MAVASMCSCNWLPSVRAQIMHAVLHQLAVTMHAWFLKKFDISMDKGCQIWQFNVTASRVSFSRKFMFYGKISLLSQIYNSSTSYDLDFFLLSSHSGGDISKQGTTTGFVTILMDGYQQIFQILQDSGIIGLCVIKKTPYDFLIYGCFHLFIRRALTHKSKAKPWHKATLLCQHHIWCASQI